MPYHWLHDAQMWFLFWTHIFGCCWLPDWPQYATSGRMH